LAAAGEGFFNDYSLIMSGKTTEQDSTAVSELSQQASRVVT
jgi:hypothetical protein